MQKQTLVAGLLAALIALCTLTSCQTAAQRQWEAKRREALNRPRKILWNDDGCDIFYWEKDVPITVENARKRLNWGAAKELAECKADTLIFNPLACGFCYLTTDTKCGDLLTSVPAPETGKYTNAFPKLIEEGADYLKLAEEFTRACGKEFFASMRMNDVHDGHWPNGEKSFLYPPFKSAHPEYLFGRPGQDPPHGVWCQVDYAQPEVRERMKGCLREFCENYDIDGIEYDFTRDPMVLKSVAMSGCATQKECDFITSYIAELRQMTEEVGKKRGRPILVVIRVPNAPDYNRAAGLDVDEWFRRGLADIMVADNWLKMDTLDASFKVPHQYGAKCYASIDTISTAERKVHKQSLDWRAGALGEAFASTADGVYYYNFFGPEVANLRGAPEDIYGKDKFFMANSDWEGSRLTAFIRDGYRYSRRPMVNTALPYSLDTNHPLTVTFDLIDDLTDSALLERKPTAAVTLTGRAEADTRLNLAVNGQPAISATVEENRWSFNVPVDYLKKGENAFTVSIPENAPQGSSHLCIMKGDALLKGASQAPWRRIMAHWDTEQEEYVDCDATVFNDITAKEHCAPNMLYPLIHHAGSEVDVSFQMLLQKFNTADATVFRIANGEYIEVLRFIPNGIQLKFCNQLVRCSTMDAFHDYRVVASGKTLRIYQDGKLLQETKMMMPAHASAGAIAEASYTIPEMNSKSLLIGSISGYGTGCSAWKNIILETPYCITFSELTFHLEYH